MPRRWILLCGFVVASAGALSVSTQTYLSMRDHGHSFARILIWQLCCWTFWDAAGPLVISQGCRFADPARRRSRERSRALLVGALLVAAHIVFQTWMTVLIQPFVPVETFTFRTALVAQAQSLWIFDLLAYTVLLLIGYGAAAYDRAQRLEMRESRLETDLARAQLDALRLEIEPHFLFNTLNSIASLIRAQAPDRALSMLLGLSDLMRTTIETPGPHSTLGAEVAFVKRYIALQTVRFMDRLSVEYAVDADCEGCQVPTFLLQPLVENAFRHGIARHPGACRLEVAAHLAGGKLHIWIRDDGAGLLAGFDLAGHAGVGLRNTQSRLERCYGASASLAVASRETGGTEVHIVLPVVDARAEPMQAAV